MRNCAPTKYTFQHFPQKEKRAPEMGPGQRVNNYVAGNQPSPQLSLRTNYPRLSLRGA